MANVAVAIYRLRSIQQDKQYYKSRHLNVCGEITEVRVTAITFNIKRHSELLIMNKTIWYIL